MYRHDGGEYLPVSGEDGCAVNPAAPCANHLLTINLEDFFHVGTLRHTIPQRHWPRFESRAEDNTLRILDLLDRHDCKATFFVLGWMAEHCPDLVAEVAKRGHEVASKGYFHRSLSDMSAEEFRADAARARTEIEKATGQEVRGYRIARGWFSRKDSWALDILAEEGYAFDASMRPVGFGWPSAKRDPYLHYSGDKSIWEFPLTSWSMGGVTLPVGGGNFVRQLPHEFLSRRIASGRNVSSPLVFYFHTWEIDGEMPRINGLSRLGRVRQYRNLEKMPGRIEHYLKSYDFTSMGRYLGLKPKPAEQRKCEAVPLVAQGAAAQTTTAPRRPVTIAVPCYNEEPVLKYLAKTLETLRDNHAHDYDFHFLFVDDASTDKTWACLQELFGGWDQTSLVQHPENQGVAAASLTGVRNAVTETVCVIDCDCTYDPEQLVAMIPALAEDVDLVTASPYHKNGRVLNVPGWRLFLSATLSRMYQAVLNHKFDTYTACFRVYRRSAVDRLQISNGGYLGVAEILARLDQSGAKIVEHPAILEARLMGQSKMKVMRVIFGHLGLLGDLIFNKSRYRAPASTQVTGTPVHQ